MTGFKGLEDIAKRFRVALMGELEKDHHPVVIEQGKTAAQELERIEVRMTACKIATEGLPEDIKPEGDE